MMSATYFGEITELNSRAVWYSDEEDDDDEQQPIQARTHDQVRDATKTDLQYERVLQSKLTKFSSIIISQSLGWRLNSSQLHNCPHLSLLGTFGANVGKAFLHQQPAATADCSLWLLFNSHCPQLQSHSVGYFVECLRELLCTEFQADPAAVQMIILSSQYSGSEHLEYLSNSNQPPLNQQQPHQQQQQQKQQAVLPFVGRPLQPPALIRNQFEAALFEQFTLSLQPALIVCLPDPRNYWFDQASHWPSIAREIVEQKLNDDNLEKTLIFT